VNQAPQSFVIAEECRKAAWQNGYRRPTGEVDGWAGFQSTTAKGAIFLTAGSISGPWYLALDHAGVVTELGAVAADVPGPGLARYAFPTLGGLYAVLPRIYALAASLPDTLLQSFLAKTKSLPSSTEAERLIVQRVGQDLFREGLMKYWNGCCPLTGILEPELLRASHIKPWKDCDTDAERLDVYNGLLLSALWDAAFDKGLVTFEDDGTPRFSPRLSERARAGLTWETPLLLGPAHRIQLAWHRQYVFDRPPNA
jgi:hypothetical protein